MRNHAEAGYAVQINYKTMTSLKQAALDWLALQDQTQPAAELVVA